MEIGTEADILLWKELADLFDRGECGKCSIGCRVDNNYI